MFDLLPKGKDIVLAVDKNNKVVLDSSEMDCQCKNPRCHYTIYNPRLGQLFERVRSLYGKPIRITSGFRCQTHNEAVGGVEKSYHTMGMALDIQPYHYDGGMDLVAELNELQAIVKAVFPFFIRYETFIHCDIRAK